MNAILIQTDLCKKEYWKSRELTRGTLDCVHQVSVYPFLKKQVFRGFGGSFTEAAA